MFCACRGSRNYSPIVVKERPFLTSHFLCYIYLHLENLSISVFYHSGKCLSGFSTRAPCSCDIVKKDRDCMAMGWCQRRKERQAPQHLLHTSQWVARPFQSSGAAAVIPASDSPPRWSASAGAMSGRIRFPGSWLKGHPVVLGSCPSVPCPLPQRLLLL